MSTTESILRYQTQINRLQPSGSDWQYKIDLAKSKLGNDLISRMGNNLDSLDTISNTDTLQWASDYLTLSLIYQQLSYSGLNQIYEDKRNYYFRQYSHQLQQAIPRLIISSGSQNYLASGEFIL